MKTSRIIIIDICIVMAALAIIYSIPTITDLIDRAADIHLAIKHEAIYNTAIAAGDNDTACANAKEAYYYAVLGADTELAMKYKEYKQTACK